MDTKDISKVSRHSNASQNLTILGKFGTNPAETYKGLNDIP